MRNLSPKYAAQKTRLFGMNRILFTLVMHTVRI